MHDAQAHTAPAGVVEAAFRADAVAPDDPANAAVVARPATDYERVKAHLVAKHTRNEGEIARAAIEMRAGVKGRHRTTIARTAFGLPLAFRCRRLQAAQVRPNFTNFEGTEHDRSASPLHLRVVPIGAQWHALALVTKAHLLATGEPLREHGGRNAFAQPHRALLDRFGDHLKSKGALDVVLA